MPSAHETYDNGKDNPTSSRLRHVSLLPALRPFGLQWRSSDVRLSGSRRDTVCRILQESIKTNAIWHHLELHLYDDYMCLDFCAPKYATAEQVEGTMESVEVNV